MALQTSGAISLNDIHVEAGGTSGTNASINDSDIRNLISKASGVAMSFNEWYGASSQQLVSFTISSATWGKFNATGYDGPGSQNPSGAGSISNATLPTLNNATSWNTSPALVINNVSTETAFFYAMRVIFSSMSTSQLSTQKSQLLGVSINGTFYSIFGHGNMSAGNSFGYPSYNTAVSTTYNGNNYNIPGSGTQNVSLHFI
tara:strand:+ start:727 stop:1332 length:606 start_codon:yes stop_codon:yes gene_type:complete